MPLVVHPRKSSAHRIACLSLYRALLRQCGQFANRHSSLPTDVLRSLITFRFGTDRKLASPTQIANGLIAGNSVLRTLRDATSGSSTALNQLLRTLQSTVQVAEQDAAARRLTAARQQPPSPAIQVQIDARNHAATKKNHRRREGNDPILMRPLPLEKITPGGRKVPHLVSARGIPFLRYPGKQPESLGRIIRQYDAWFVKKETQWKELRSDQVLARYEDDWDTVLEQEFPDYSAADSDKGDRQSWVDSVATSSAELNDAVRDKIRKHEEMGAKMWEVVKKEKALAEEEAITNKAKKPQ